MGDSQTIRNWSNMKADKQYQKGHFIEMGITIGLPMGVPIGLLLGSIALGFVLGLAVGLSMGVAMEKIYNKNPIPLATEEKRRQKKWSWMGISVGLFAFIMLNLLYFLQI